MKLRKLEGIRLSAPGIHNAGERKGYQDISDGPVVPSQISSDDRQDCGADRQAGDGKGLGGDWRRKALSFVRNLLIYGYLIFEMAKGDLSLPAFLLYVGIVSGFGAWMSGLFEALQQIWQNEELMDAYRDFMDFGIVSPEGKKELSREGGPHEIRLENVSFRYEGSEEDTIHDLSLTIVPGTRWLWLG